jgi:hypothetical protein
MSRLMATYALLADSDNAPEVARHFIRLTQYLAEVGSEELELPKTPVVGMSVLFGAMLSDLRFLADTLAQNLGVTVATSHSQAEFEAVAWETAQGLDDLIQGLEQAMTWNSMTDS